MAWKKYEKESWKKDALAAAGEFLGTFMFLLLGLAGIQAARDAGLASGNGLDAAFLLMASTSMAMALIFSIWVFFRVTGAAFNPNISLALFIIGNISFRRFAFYVIAQLLGAIAASAVLLGILPGPLLVNTQRASNVGIAQALFWEMFLTLGLVLTVLFVAVEKHKGTILAPLAIGFALFSTQLAGIQYTGAAVNTARAFGPAVVNGEFVGSHWIYWLGPSMGAALAAGLYLFLVKVKYWEVTPGADAQAPHEADREAKYPSRAPGERHDGLHDGNAAPGYGSNGSTGNSLVNGPGGHNNTTGTTGTYGVGHHGTTGTTGTQGVGHHGTTGTTGTTGGAMHPTGHNIV